MEDVEELIRRPGAANFISDGLEDKLYGILEHFDGLLLGNKWHGMNMVVTWFTYPSNSDSISNPHLRGLCLVVVSLRARDLSCKD